MEEELPVLFAVEDLSMGLWVFSQSRAVKDIILESSQPVLYEVELLPSLALHFTAFHASLGWIPCCYWSSDAISERLMHCKSNCDNPEL